MSDDLVARLRDERHCRDWYMRLSAAARIEALEAENARLREAAKGSLVIVNAAQAGRKAAESALAEAVEVMRPLVARYEPRIPELDPDKYSNTIAELKIARAFIASQEPAEQEK